MQRQRPLNRFRSLSRILEKQRYCILEDVIEESLRTSLGDAIARIKGAFGVAPATKDFEGRETHKL
jgi:hypothetical protein